MTDSTRPLDSTEPAERPGSRRDWLSRLENGDHPDWDVIIIGGGITGAGLLRECARRNLKALLVEKRDFAWGTSSKSSKMVHGGLRYIAAGDWKLTRDSVRERQRLLTESPGLVEPLPFIMGHYRHQFPGPRLFNTLLSVYDFMAGRRNHRFYPSHEQLCLAPGLARSGLKGLTRFADAVTDDARLVLRVLQESIGDEVAALNYVSADGLIRDNDTVVGVSLRDDISGVTLEQRARVVINATGAWVDQLRESVGGTSNIRPLRGSHLVIPHWRLPVAFSISFFHPRDKRPVFVFPWEGVTVVGTTDLDHDQSLERDSHITCAEMDYLLDAVHHAFPDSGLTPDHILSTWSGIRPVVSTGQKDPSKEKREHSVWDENGLITVAGGKLTTFRLIALHVLEKAEPYLGKPTRRTDDDVKIFSEPSERLPRGRLTPQQRRRLTGRYGDRALGMVREAAPSDLDSIDGTDYLWAELKHACRHEYVVHLDDLLLRRTRLGLLLPRGGADWLAQFKNRCQTELGWSDATWNDEVQRYHTLWQTDFGVPARTHRDCDDTEQ